MPKKATHCLTAIDIINYLNNKLSSVEEHELEVHILDCELCRLAIEGYSNQQNYEALLSKIEDLKIDNKIIPFKNTPVDYFKKNKWARWSAAALVVGTSTVAYYSHYQQIQSYSDLAAAYGKLLPAPCALVRDKDLTTKAAIDKAFWLYKQGNYEASLADFETILKKNPQDTEIAFYAGLCAIGKKDWEKAKNYLKKVPLSTENKNKKMEDAVWYLAMAELQTDNPELAKYYLNKLVQTPNSWHGKAKEMLKKLND